MDRWTDRPTDSKAQAPRSRTPWPPRPLLSTSLHSPPQLPEASPLPGTGSVHGLSSPSFLSPLPPFSSLPLPACIFPWLLPLPSPLVPSPSPSPLLLSPISLSSAGLLATPGFPLTQTSAECGSSSLSRSGIPKSKFGLAASSPLRPRPADRPRPHSRVRGCLCFGDVARVAPRFGGRGRPRERQRRAGSE